MILSVALWLVSHIPDFWECSAMLERAGLKFTQISEGPQKTFRLSYVQQSLRANPSTAEHVKIFGTSSGHVFLTVEDLPLDLRPRPGKKFFVTEEWESLDGLVDQVLVTFHEEDGTRIGILKFRQDAELEYASRALELSELEFQKIVHSEFQRPERALEIFNYRAGVPGYDDSDDLKRALTRSIIRPMHRGLVSADPRLRGLQVTVLVERVYDFRGIVSVRVGAQRSAIGHQMDPAFTMLFPMETARERPVTVHPEIHLEFPMDPLSERLPWIEGVERPNTVTERQ